jgi:hypothetical protein
MAKREIDISKLPSNDLDPPFKDGDGRPTTRPVVKGPVRERSGGSRFAADIRDISGYLFEEVLMPALKGIVEEFVTGGVGMLLWGHDTRRSVKPSRGGTKVKYGSMYKGTPADTRRSHRSVREEVGVDDITFASRQDAYATLDYLDSLLAKGYHYVTIGDLRSAAGLSVRPKHERYGWRNLRGANVHYTRDGYILSLPEPDYIER